MIDFTEWLTAQDASPHTIMAYTGALAAFATWFVERTGQACTPVLVTPLDVRNYRQHLVDQGRAPATINTMLAALRAWSRWARATHQAEHDLTNGVKALRAVESAPHWLTRPEQQKLLRVARQAVQLGDVRAGGDRRAPAAIWPRRDLALIALLLNTGLRLAEALALTRADLDLGERAGAVTVRQGKGRKHRTVPLNKSAREALLDWLAVRPAGAESDAVFLSQKGGPLSRRALAAMVESLAATAGLADVTPHTLRHSFAKNLVDAGVPLDQVAALLGHSSLDTTKLYTTPSAADLRRAADRVAWED